MTGPEFTAMLSRVAMRVGMDWAIGADMTNAQKLELISAVKSWLDDLEQEIEAERRASQPEEPDWMTGHPGGISEA